jgi:hypothetical protein
MVKFFQCVVLIILFFSSIAFSKLKVGISGYYDIYQSYVNPDIPSDTTLKGTGSVLGSFGLCPKLCLGVNYISLSVEGGINYAPFAFDGDEFKGFGSLAFPVMVKINILGLSNIDSEGFGVGLGCGLQYSKTELYGKPIGYTKSIKRDYFKTYILEIDLGSGGVKGNSAFFIRYGFGDNKSSTLNIGICVNI